MRWWQCCNILAISLSVLRIIILMIRTKLFSDLYLAKFLDTLTKLLFPCTILFAYNMESQSRRDGGANNRRLFHDDFKTDLYIHLR